MEDLIFYRSAEQSVKEALQSLKDTDTENYHKVRREALAYYQYKGTDEYVKPFFDSVSFQKELPIYTTNITKRLIKRISLTYKNAPTRNVDNEKYIDLTRDKNLAMKQFERLHNLSGTVALRIGFKDGRFTYTPIMEYTPFFDAEDVLNPIGLSHSIRADEDMFVYWSADEHFMYNGAGKRYRINEDNVNPYGILPMVFAQPDTIVDEHFNLGAIDIAQANKQIDIALTMLSHHIKVAGGQFVGTGDIDLTKIEFGLYKMPVVPEGAAITNIAPGVNITNIIDGIKYQMLLVQGNHHIKFDFGFTGSKSGVSIKLENIELLEDREDSVEQFNVIEQRIYEIEKAIAWSELGIRLPDSFSINFAEIEFPDPDKKLERRDWNKQHGLENEVDWLIQDNPDGFEDREEAEEYLAERRKSLVSVKKKADEPENIFKL